jgi:hypothetical protein
MDLWWRFRWCVLKLPIALYDGLTCAVGDSANKVYNGAHLADEQDVIVVSMKYVYGYALNTN